MTEPNKDLDLETKVSDADDAGFVPEESEVQETDSMEDQESTPAEYVEEPTSEDEPESGAEGGTESAAEHDPELEAGAEANAESLAEHDPKTAPDESEAETKPAAKRKAKASDEGEEKPKTRRRATVKKAAAEEGAAPKTRRAAAKTGEQTTAQKLERERREENIDRMLRGQQRAERNERNQKFYAGVSALQEAMRRKRILHGTVASIEQVSVEGTNIAAQRTTTLLGVMLDERFKVMIPFEEFYRDNPIDMSKVDFSSEEGIANFGRRQRQMSERLYGCEIDFLITNVMVNSPTDYSIFGSRRQAMEILEIRNYITADNGAPYIRVGDVRDAEIISVGSFGLFCNVAGVDVTIPLRDVTYQYVTNLNNLYKSGDKIEVDITEISRRKDGRVELVVNAKAAELRSAKERQASGFLRVGTTTIGQITSIRKSQRDPDKIVIHAYLPYFKMPVVVASMNPNTLAAAPQAGDALRLVVTGFSESGFVRANCRGFHNVVNLTSR